MDPSTGIENMVPMGKTRSDETLPFDRLAAIDPERLPSRESGTACDGTALNCRTDPDLTHRAMPPIRFTCTVVVDCPPRAISERIREITNWPDFPGYGPLPGIESAAVDVKTENVVGSRVRVTNEDGSEHTEEFVEWKPTERVRLQLKEFTPPVSYLAERFDETWTFDVSSEGTTVQRDFEMHPTSVGARPLLWGISFLLKRAVARHLAQMRRELGREP